MTLNLTNDESHRARRLAIDAIRARITHDRPAEDAAIGEAVLDSADMLQATIDAVVDAAAGTVRGASMLLRTDPVDLFDTLADRADFDRVVGDDFDTPPDAA